MDEPDGAQMLLWLSLESETHRLLLSVFSSFVKCLMFVMLLIIGGLGLFWEL